VEFNKSSPLTKNLDFTPLVNYSKGKISIKQPSTSNLSKIRYPTAATNCELTIIAVLFELENGYRSFSPMCQKHILGKGAKNPPIVDAEFAIPDGCLCIVSIFLNYFSLYDQYLEPQNSRTHSPGGISGAILSPGTYLDTNSLPWTNMHELRFPQF